MTTKEEQHFAAHIFCCNNERPVGHARGCCKEKGADALRNYMKVRIKEEGLPEMRVNVSGCLDHCELGPVFVIYPQGVWYTCANTADIDEVIAKHLKGGEIVTRLRLKKGQKELTPEQIQGRSKEKTAAEA